MVSHDDLLPAATPDLADLVFYRVVADVGGGLTDGLGVCTFTQMQTLIGGGGGAVAEADIAAILALETPISPLAADEITLLDSADPTNLKTTTITQLGAKLITDGELLVDGDFTAATTGFLTKTSAGVYTVTRVKANATGNPTATDDDSIGYSVGSLWYNLTTDKAYTCVDSTATAAVWVEITVTDHGALTGLADDDHTQYHTDARGDARYSLLAHTHTLADVTDSGALAALATVGTTEIDDEAVTNAKLAHVNTATLKGRTTAGTGDPEDLTKTQALALLNVEDGADVSPVASVNAATGVVVLDADDLADGATNVMMLATERTKLTGVETGAEVNHTLWDTSEQSTGKTGLSGGTIYTKAFSGITVPTGAGTVSTAHGITAIILTRPIKIDLYYGNGTDSYYGNAPVSGSIRVYATVDATNIVITTAGSFPSGFTAQVVLEYQKT